jgi:5-methylcytosine-specific restriction endonuclease McrA
MIDRFEAKFVRGAAEECWLWRAGRAHQDRGNGIISDPNGRVRTAHAVAYELYVGPVPRGHQVYHRCDEVLCVNPAHLFTAPAHATEAQRYAIAGLPMPTERACRVCGQTKPLDDFPQHQGGRRRECDACHRQKRSIRFQKNKHKYAPARLAWYMSNLERNDFRHAERRARKSGATEFMSFEEWLALRATTDCHWCGITLHPGFRQIDHIRPLCFGGQHDATNVVMACANCNMRREWERKAIRRA